MNRLVALLAVCLVVGACDSVEQPANGGVRIPDRTDEPSVLQRALVACYRGQGIDAHAMSSGGVLFDQHGTLSREESFARAAVCARRAEALGLVPTEDTSEAALRSRYTALERINECLRALGYQVDEMVNVDLFVADPSTQPHPYDHLAEMGERHLERGFSECPDEE